MFQPNAPTTMQQPPEGLDLLDAMREGVAFSFELHIRKATIRLRPLSSAEQRSIYSQVNTQVLHARKQGNEMTNFEADLARAQGTLIMASSDEYGKNPQLGPYQLDRMTSDEILYIYREYLAMLDKVSPSLETFEAEEAKALVELLKKNKDQLNELTYKQLRGILSWILSTQD